MTRDEPAEEKDSSLIEREAVAWFTRMGGTPTRAERRDFSSWLAASPENEAAYEGVRRVLTIADSTAANLVSRGDELADPLQRIAVYRRESARAKIGRFTVGCLALLAACGWLWLEHPNFLQNLQADHVTARGERRTVVLADGSTVLMDADTAIDTENASGERRIRLLRGAAFFTVQPSQTPFIVQAAGGESRVLGTQFDVMIDSLQGATVTLSNGSLQVAVEGRSEKVVLLPGESIGYDPAGLGAVWEANLEESTAWHDGRLIFTDARLADVVAHIERYRNGRIVLVGSAVGERRVSGNISLENTDAALKAMQSSVGFRMTDLGGKLTMIGP